MLASTSSSSTTSSSVTTAFVPTSTVGMGGIPFVPRTSSSTNTASDAFLMKSQTPTTTPRLPSSSSSYEARDSQLEFEHTPYYNGSLRLKLGVGPSSTEGSVQQQQQKHRPLVIGHRGALYDALENTLEGFRLCTDVMGADGIELDVMRLDNGDLIVFHGGGTDEDPGDLTDYCIGQDGKSIFDFPSWESTQCLEFNPNYVEFGCSAEAVQAGRIPTLRQVLQDYKDKKEANNSIIKIELKGEGTTEPVLKLVEEMDMVQQCHFSSFDHDRIALVRKLHPERDATTGKHVYQTGALFCDDPLPYDFIDRALAVGATEVHVRYDTCTTEVVDAIHNAGMSSMAWISGPAAMQDDISTKYTTDVGNEDDRMYQALIDTGVQQLCVNRPNQLVNLLSKKKQAH